jgi:hypothetical protein
MKKSAWYSGLWRKKLNELPVKDSADLAWLEMNKLLDKQMPQNNGSNGVKKFISAKVASVLAYVLPAAAMIGTVSYFSLHTPAHSKKAKHEKYDNKHLKNRRKHDAQLQSDSITFTDSLNKVSGIDSLSLEPNINPGLPAITFKGKDDEIENSQQSGNSNALRYLKDSKKQGNKIADADYLGYPTEFRNEGKNKLVLPLRDTDLQKPAGGSLFQNMIHENKFNKNELNSIGQESITLNGPTPIRSDLPKRVKKRIAKLQATKKSINPGQPRYVKLKKKSARNKFNTEESELLPAFNYGLGAGFDLAGVGKNIYIGATGAYAINKKWLVNSGVRIDIKRPISGEYTHRSFNPVDSSRFRMYDSRKVQTITIPVDVEYRLSKRISIHAGPNFSYTLKQSDIVGKLGTISNYRDTLNKSGSIDSALKHSAISKFTVGVSTGISLRTGRFYLDSRYLQTITPYKVNTGLGEYKKRYAAFQIGVRYMFISK